MTDCSWLDRSSFFFGDDALLQQQLDQSVRPILCGAPGFVRGLGFRGRTPFPVNSEGWRKDGDIISVSYTDGEGKAVIQGSEVGTGADGDPEKGFPVVGFSVLSEDLKTLEEGFALQGFPFFACEIGDLVEDNNQGLGNERIAGLVADDEIIAVFAVEVVSTGEGHGDACLAAEVRELIEHRGERDAGCHHC